MTLAGITQSLGIQMSAAFTAAVTVRRDATQDRYQEPSHWRKVTVQELISGTRGTAPETLQAGFDSFVAGERGREVVFVAGDLTLVKQPAISVVGTRQVSSAGAANARRIALDLAIAGIVLVSGLAEGVDTQAMTSAMENGGRVIGVIGTPLDRAYPAKNAALQEAVYQRHLLVSQFPSGARVFKSNFPQRNRLMALLSDATIIVEASDTSGTLHQAAECLRQGRWLFISKPVVDDVNLTWPKRFLGKPRVRILDSILDVDEAFRK